MNRLALIMLMLLLAACNPLRPQSLELPSLPQNYSETGATTQLTLADRWWTAFDDPQLDRLQKQLFSESLELSQAIYKLEQLRAAEQITAASRQPNVSFSGSLSREQTPTMSGSSRSTSTKGIFSASYEIDLWNKLSDQQKAAELRSRAGEHEVQALLLSLSAQLAESYFSLIEQRLQLDLLNRQIKRNEALLETISDRYRVGLASSSDVYRARRELVALRSQIPSIQTSIASSEHTLAVLLGRFPGHLSVTDAKLPEPIDLDGVGLPADLLSRRPDVAAALIELKSADHELAAALADQLPAINLSATLGRSLTQLASGDIEGTLWSLGLGLTQPLLDGGRRAAVSQQQEAARAEKLAAVRIAILNAVKDVDSALAAERGSRARSQLIDQQQRISADSLLLTERNYRSGLVDSDSLLDQEISHLDILSQQLSNQRERLSNRVALARALGGSWMAEELTRQRTHLTDAEDNSL